METYNLILAEVQKIYQLYHQQKTHKYENLTDKEILPSDKTQTIEQVNFWISPLGKIIEKQTKTTKDQGKKQGAAFQSLNINLQLNLLLEDLLHKEATD